MNGCRYSDETQKAALKVAKRCILFNERPSQSQRDLLAAQIDDIIARIDKAAMVRNAKKHQDSGVKQVIREERGRR